MRCPVVVGRSKHLAVLDAAVAGAARGSGSCIALVGEPGVGKTRLVDEAGRMAGNRGLLSGVGHASPEQSVTPLRPIAEALLALTRGRPAPPPDSSGLRGYLPVLAELIPPWRPPRWRPPAESLTVVAEAILRLLTELAGDDGVMLVVEDLHWADAQTVAVVRHLAEHGAAAGTCVLITARPGEATDALRDLLAHPRVGRVDLARLSDGNVGEMVAACVGAASSTASLVERLVRDSGGLPLLVEELLLSRDAEDEVAPRFTHSVRARLARLDATARTVIEVAALLGTSADWRLLAPATGLPGTELAAALHHTGALALTVNADDAVAFRHALTRDVVLDAIGEVRRRALCLEVAGALAGLGERSADLEMATARLLAEGGAGERAARLLLDAARRALADTALRPAEVMLRRGRELSAAGTALHLEISRELASTLLLTGRPSEAADLAGAALASAEGRDKTMAVALRLLMARAAVAAQAWDEAQDHLNRVRCDQGHDEGVAAEVAVLDARVSLGTADPGSRVGAEHTASAAAGMARHARRPDLECEALEVLGLCARLRDLDAAADAVHRALSLAEAGDLPLQRLRLLNELGTIEMLRDARPDSLERASSEALRAGALALTVGIDANRAAVAVMTGDFDRGVAIAAGMQDVAARLDLRPLEAAAHLMTGFAMAHRGRRREADRHLALAESLAPDDLDLRAGAWAIGRGLLALLEEDRPAARRAMAEARRRAPDLHARILNPYEGPELLLRALAGEAGVDEVERVAAASVVGARWPALWVGSAQAVAAGAAGSAALAESSLATALAAGDRYPVFGALARRLVAEAALRDGWTDAAPLLRDAELTFAELGISRCAAACRDLLRRSGQSATRRRGRDLLLPAPLRAAAVTEREAQVLDLMADGLSNRELGRRLFASPRTIEKHVASLLAKLHAADRDALADISRSVRAGGVNGGDPPMTSAAGSPTIRARGPRGRA